MYCLKAFQFTFMHKPYRKLGVWNTSQSGNVGLCFFFFSLIISYLLHYFCSIESPQETHQASYTSSVLQAQKGQMAICFSVCILFLLT